MWSFHDRIYTFCKSVLFSNIECLIFEFFRFLNWRKALKVFYIWILHVKLLKYITSRDFVTYFLIYVGGVNKSLALHQLIVSFPISKETDLYFIKKFFKFDSKYLSQTLFWMHLYWFQLSNYKLVCSVQLCT